METLDMIHPLDYFLLIHLCKPEWSRRAGRVIKVPAR
jgi:hypothetical protein